MKKAIPFLLLSLACSAHGATWKDSPYVEITKLYPTDGGMAFYTTYSDTSVSSCDSGTRFGILSTDENYEVKVSTLLAAFMAGKKVLLRYDSSQEKQCSAIINRFMVAR